MGRDLIDYLYDDNDDRREDRYYCAGLPELPNQTVNWWFREDRPDAARGHKPPRNAVLKK